MAQLSVQPDPLVPGRWTLRSTSPAALAAVPDVLVRSLGLEHDTLGAWALHPDEQDGMRDAAYRDELGMLGQLAHARVHELPRPWQQNVVWVDRYHLLVHAADARLAGKLLGWYVGSKGELLLAVFDPSVAAMVQHSIDQIPDTHPSQRDQLVQQLLQHSRFLAWFRPEEQGELILRTPTPMAQRVHDALAEVHTIIQPW